MTLSPGARLGPYEILSPLGVGGMGEVYRARDTRLDRTVAIKILPDALAADPQFRERFDREARAISQLDHPHICALYDVGEHDGTAYLVMQYLEGETLADRLVSGALPLDQALKTAIEIASALDNAHRAGIVHRDLKPGNIMLTKSGAKLLLRSDSAAVYSPPGYVLFMRESTLMAQRFDLATLAMRGEAVAVAEGVGRFYTVISFVVSDNGTLIYRPAVASQTRLSWMNRAGQTQGNGAPAGDYQGMSLSPDDKRVAFARTGQTDTDVWLTDLDRRITSRFTFRPPLNNVPIWSPDGRQIVFASARDGLLDLYQRASDASRPDELLLKLTAQPILFPSDWSADGRFLTYYRTDPKTQLDIWTLSLGADRKPVPFLHADFNESQGQFSPDGRWIAYVSDESGGQQVYVQSFPTLGGQRQISTEGGTQPRWRRDGKELFYLAPDRKLMAVTVKAGATFESDAPRALFQTELNVTELRQSYAVSADGQRFLLNTSLEAGSPPMTVVLNWPALLKK